MSFYTLEIRAGTKYLDAGGRYPWIVEHAMHRIDTQPKLGSSTRLMADRTESAFVGTTQCQTGGSEVREEDFACP